MSPGGVRGQKRPRCDTRMRQLGPFAGLLPCGVHLDASTMENGPLRVIPESHHSGVLADEAVLDYVKHHEPVECLVRRGGVLAMRPLLLHSSSKARSEDPRRVLHIEYAESMDLGPRIRLAVA